MSENGQAHSATAQQDTDNAVQATRSQRTELAISPAARSLHHPRTAELIRGLLAPHPVQVTEFLHQAIRELDRVSLEYKLTPKSVNDTVMNCAHLGLIPGNARGWAHFVAFKNGRLSKQHGIDIHDLQLVVGYQGYVELGFRSGFLHDIHCDVVLQGEPLERYTDETGPKFRHDLPENRPAATPKNVTHSYCVWMNRHGVHGHLFVDRADIDKVSKPDSDSWRYAFGAMAMKTAVRRAQKFWQSGPMSHSAAYIDEQTERGERQENLAGIDAPIAEEPDETFLDVAGPEDTGWLVKTRRRIADCGTPDEIAMLSEEANLSHHEGVADDREHQIVMAELRQQMARIRAESPECREPQ